MTRCGRVFVCLAIYINNYFCNMGVAELGSMHNVGGADYMPELRPGEETWAGLV